MSQILKFGREVSNKILCTAKFILQVAYDARMTLTLIIGVPTSTCINLLIQTNQIEMSITFEDIVGMLHDQCRDEPAQTNLYSVRNASKHEYKYEKLRTCA